MPRIAILQGNRCIYLARERRGDRAQNSVRMVQNTNNASQCATMNLRTLWRVVDKKMLNESWKQETNKSIRQHWNKHNNFHSSKYREWKRQRRNQKLLSNLTNLKQTKAIQIKASTRQTRTEHLQFCGAERKKCVRYDTNLCYLSDDFCIHAPYWRESHGEQDLKWNTHITSCSKRIQQNSLWPAPNCPSRPNS